MDGYEMMLYLYRHDHTAFVAIFIDGVPLTSSLSAPRTTSAAPPYFPVAEAMQSPVPLSHLVSVSYAHVRGLLLGVQASRYSVRCCSFPPHSPLLSSTRQVEVRPIVRRECRSASCRDAWG